MVLRIELCGCKAVQNSLTLALSKYILFIIFTMISKETVGLLFEAQTMLHNVLCYVIRKGCQCCHYFFGRDRGDRGSRPTV